MAQWSLTELSFVTLFDRIDSEYYLPEYILNQSTLSRIETVALPQWFFVSDGNHLSVSKHFSDSEEIPYFRGQDVNDFFLENANPIRIPKKVYKTPMMRRSYFLSRDVLLSIVGTIGSLSIVPDTIGEATGSCKIAILRSKGKCSSFFLAAYLMSKYGQLQIKRNTRGAVQMGLILKDLSRIRVPKFSDDYQAQIETLVKNSMSVNRQSKTLYSQAQHLLESELGLDKLSFQKPMGYTARFSDIVTNRRFDADYYQTRFAVIRQIVKNYPNGYEQLIHIATPLKPNIDPSKTPDQIYSYIELSNINASLGTVDGFESKFGKNLPSRARRQVQHGDIIASAVVGSIDKAAVIDHAHNNYLASTGFFHLRPIKISSEYLLMLVRSKCVCMQFQQESTGGILSAVPDSRLKNILVPNLPERLQQEITTLVIRSHEAKKKSQELLDQAKTRVEQLIEKAVRS